MSSTRRKASDQSLAFLGALFMWACSSPAQMSQMPMKVSNPTEPPSSSPDAGVSGPAFVIVRTGQTFVATSSVNSKIAVEVDCDDGRNDGHDFGITPVLDGRRLDAFMWDAKFGFLVPDADAGPMKCVAVESDADALTVSFEAGSYRALDASAPDKPVPLLAHFRVSEQGKLTAEVSGLYYLMPSKRNTSLALTLRNQAPQNRTVTQAAGASVEYFTDVTRIFIDDAEFGHIQVDTDIKRLQLEVFGTSAQLEFELDLDHSFKDSGQESVTSKITFLE